MAKRPAQKAGLIWLQVLLLVVAVFVIYSPVLRGGWLGDDDLLVANNSLVRDPTGLWNIWAHPERMIDFQPVKFSFVWLQWQLWGDDTLGYHLTNVVLHLVSCFLLWRLLDRFHLRWAWLGALIFAVHPVQVESVAYISELKNTLSLPLFLLAAIYWIDFDARHHPRDYVLALAFFLIAMLCKGTMVMFPVVILLYAWWRRGKISGSDLQRSVPFFAISLVMGIIIAWFLHHHAIGGQGVTIGGPLTRLALAGLTTSFYFAKCFFPVGLMPVYPRWIVDPPSPLQFLPLLVFAVMVAWLWTKRAGWGRHTLLGLGFFLINLAPFAGFTAGSYMSFTWVTEHTLYLPIIGLIGVSVAALEHLFKILPQPWKRVELVAVSAVLLALFLESFNYAHAYTGQQALCDYTLEKNPRAIPAHLGLGLIAKNEGRLAEALSHAEAVVNLDPNLALGYILLGETLYKQGDFTGAEQRLRIAAKIDPGNADAAVDLADVLARTSRYSDAINYFNRALDLRPGRTDALAGRGEAWRCLGDLRGAVTDYDAALAIDPNYLQALLGRGVVRLAQRDLAGALADLSHYRELASTDPNSDYAALWIWIIERQQNRPADADRDLHAAMAHGWIAGPDSPVSNHALFLLGTTPEVAYLAAQPSDPGAQCEAYYYAGMKRLLANDKRGAAADFQASIATGKRDFFEYSLAQGELNALGTH